MPVLPRLRLHFLSSMRMRMVTTRSSAGDDSYFLTTRTTTRIPTTTSSCCSSAKTKGLSNSVARFERRQKRWSSQLSRQTLKSIYLLLFISARDKNEDNFQLGRDFEGNVRETYTTLCYRYRSRIVPIAIALELNLSLSLLN